MSVRRKALPVDAAVHFQTGVPGPIAPPRQSERPHTGNSGSTQSWPEVKKSQLLQLAVNQNPNVIPTWYYVGKKVPDVTASERIQGSLSIDSTNNSLVTEIKVAGDPFTSGSSKSGISLNRIGTAPDLDPVLLSSILHHEQPSSREDQSSRKAKVASALQDASIFLGGLIKHPTQSTRHFTILRHSHGLVYYKGPTTSIAITVFSDRPLPSNRRYWFQMKGWSGDTGMRAKALFRTNGSWINVTPTKNALAADLSSMDERAWQRDIKKFQEKAPNNLKNHAVRETAVIRVPSEAIDGYFRIVLTGAGDKSPLCPSPVFRIASTSASATSIKGASLSTLPIELTVNILQYAAKTVSSNFVAPFAETARAQVSSSMPSAVSIYGSTAYDMSGIQGQINALEGQYAEWRDLAIDGSRGIGNQYIPMARPDVIGEDTGPEAPFPIHLNGKVVRGSGIGLREVGMPTANLGDIDSDTIAKLNGIYSGWVLVTPKDEKQQELHSEWRHAIVTISFDHAKSSVAAKKVVRAYLLHNFGEHQFIDAKISLVLMGYLRPTIPFKDKEAFFTETMRDIEITHLSLEREQWQAETTLQRIQTVKSQRSFTDRYVDGRMAVQRQVDKVPVHLLGIRSESFRLNDRDLYGNGGLYIKRDGA